MADTTKKLTQLKYIQRVTGKDSQGNMTLEPMIVGANAYIYTNKNILLTDAKTPTKGFGANSIYLGTGIKGTEANQLIIGQYNNSTTDIFTIGGGSSATQKKDIFTVSSNGTITQVGDYSGTVGQFRLWGKKKTDGERPMMSIHDGLDGQQHRYKSVGFVDLNEFTTISNGIHLVTQQTVKDNIYQGRGIVQVVGVLQLGTQEDDPKNKGQSICVPRLRGANGTVHIGTSDDNDKTTIHGSLTVTGTSNIAGIEVGKNLTVEGVFTANDVAKFNKGFQAIGDIITTATSKNQVFSTTLTAQGEIVSTVTPSGSTNTVTNIVTISNGLKVKNSILTDGLTNTGTTTLEDDVIANKIDAQSNKELLIGTSNSHTDVGQSGWWTNVLGHFAVQGKADMKNSLDVHGGFHVYRIPQQNHTVSIDPPLSAKDGIFTDTLSSRTGSLKIGSNAESIEIGQSQKKTHIYGDVNIGTPNYHQTVNLQGIVSCNPGFLRLRQTNGLKQRASASFHTIQNLQDNPAYVQCAYDLPVGGATDVNGKQSEYMYGFKTSMSGLAQPIDKEVNVTFCYTIANPITDKDTQYFEVATTGQATKDGSTQSTSNIEVIFPEKTYIPPGGIFLGFIMEKPTSSNNSSPVTILNNQVICYSGCTEETDICADGVRVKKLVNNASIEGTSYTWSGLSS